MKIYTKTGDKGKTSLLGKNNVDKYDLRIESYGTIDELNSYLGASISIINKYINLDQDQSSKTYHIISKNIEVLKVIQSQLFNIGSELATVNIQQLNKINLINIDHITLLEKKIDAYNDQIKPLKNFILPGGHETSAYLHLTRSICRRAERVICQLNSEEPIRLVILEYINRLSDFLFMSARFYNHIFNVQEILWHDGKKT